MYKKHLLTLSSLGLTSLLCFSCSKNNIEVHKFSYGKMDEDVLPIPKSIKKGRIIKVKVKSTGRSRYDFEYTDKNTQYKTA